MRIAIAGKGGAGKTTIAATLARVLARGGTTVIAIDGDSNPNLALALGGIQPDAALPTGIVSRRLDGPAVTVPLDQLVADHTYPAPDGVRTATMGAATHAHEGCLCSAHATVSAILADLGTRPDVVAILDLEASPEHFSRGTARHVDALLLVTEPYYRSLETTRRMAALAAELPVPRVVVVANKVRSPDDTEVIAEFCARHGLELGASVPYDDAVLAADRARVPLVDHHASSTVVGAVSRLVEVLLPQRPSYAGA